MRDIREVLQAKEEQLIRVREEVEALRLAAPLLSDEKGDEPSPLPENGPQRVVNLP
jgi:hypothetical protein